MTAPLDTAGLDQEVEREAERIAESMVQRAPNFLEKVTGDFYEMLLVEVQTYLKDNAAFNIKSELSSLRSSLQFERSAREAAEAALTAKDSELAEARAALSKIICANTHLVWTGGAVPEPSHEEFGTCAEIARAFLLKGQQSDEKLCPHAPTYDAGLCCGHPDDCTFISPPVLSREKEAGA